MTAANPFLDPLLAVDNGGPLDAVEAWERVRYKRDIEIRDEHVTAAADRLAKHATSLRTWVEQLERENGELRDLVTRAANLHSQDLLSSVIVGPLPWMEWAADADRVLAAGGEDESE